MKMQNECEYLPIEGSFITGRIGTDQRVTYKAEEDGIVKVVEILDQDNKRMCGLREVILPKEVFVAAYNAYIKECE